MTPRLVPAVPPRVMAARALLMGAALGAWFATQAALGSRPPVSGGPGIRDAVHAWTAPCHDWLAGHPSAADALLLASSLGIDLLGAALFVSALLGRSLRPFVGMLVIFLLRQTCQFCCALPAPEGMIWHSPGIPSLLVTYGVAGDFFFSGHTAIAVFGCVELARRGRRWLWLAVPLAAFEVAAVLVLRAHWTMDVVAGAAVAAWVGGWSEAAGRRVDGWLTRVAGTPELGRMPPADSSGGAP